MLSALAVGRIKRLQPLAISVAGARRVAPMTSAAGGVILAAVLLALPEVRVGNRAASATSSVLAAAATARIVSGVTRLRASSARVLVRRVRLLLHTLVDARRIAGADVTILRHPVAAAISPVASMTVRGQARAMARVTSICLATLSRTPAPASMVTPVATLTRRLAPPRRFPTLPGRLLRRRPLLLRPRLPRLLLSLPRLMPPRFVPGVEAVNVGLPRATLPPLRRTRPFRPLRALRNQGVAPSKLSRLFRQLL